MGRVGGIEIGANWTWRLFPALLVWSLGGAVFPSTNPGLASGTYAAMARALDGRVAGFLDAADVLRRARRGRPAPVAG
jgi:hypothetical protein